MRPDTRPHLSMPKKLLASYGASTHVHFSHTCFVRFGRDLFSLTIFQVEDEMSSVRERYGEAFLAGAP
jgi:hypothetical protein